MPELEKAWQLARDKPAETTKFLNIYTAFTLLAIDEWLLDEPDESTRSTLLELLERRNDQASRCSAPNTHKEIGTSIGAGVHADAIMDGIVHNTIWVETGGHNMREHRRPPMKRDRPGYYL